MLIYAMSNENLQAKTAVVTEFSLFGLFGPSGCTHDIWASAPF